MKISSVPRPKPSLLAPAGDFVALRAGILAGADEIYFGVRGFNMRANAGNFSISDIKKVVGLCHKNKVKAYLALNTIIYQAELDKVEKIICKAKSAGIDAVIAWDMAVIGICERHKVRIHLSTQASVSNLPALLHYKKSIKGLKRVVLARECSLADIREIITNMQKKGTGIEIEAFIHGAMCISVSGRCLLSQEIYGRSANRGECLQPCRRLYKASITDSEEGTELFVGEDYVLSPRDICTMPFIELLIEAGISSFKIEGRNRSPEYVKYVTASYRRAIDYYINNRQSILRKASAQKEFDALKKSLVLEMKKVYNRGFSSGFYMGKPINEWSGSYGSNATTAKEYIGRVLNYYPRVGVAEVKIESECLNVGDLIMFQGYTTGVMEQTISELEIQGKRVQHCAKGKSVGVKIGFKARMNDKVYRIARKIH